MDSEEKLSDEVTPAGAGDEVTPAGAGDDGDDPDDAAGSGSGNDILEVTNNKYVLLESIANNSFPFLTRSGREADAENKLMNTLLNTKFTFESKESIYKDHRTNLKEKIKSEEKAAAQEVKVAEEAVKAKELEATRAQEAADAKAQAADAKAQEVKVAEDAVKAKELEATRAQEAADAKAQAADAKAQEVKVDTNSARAEGMREGVSLAEVAAREAMNDNKESIINATDPRAWGKFQNALIKAIKAINDVAPAPVDVVPAAANVGRRPMKSSKVAASDKTKVAAGAAAGAAAAPAAGAAAGAAAAPAAGREAQEGGGRRDTNDPERSLDELGIRGGGSKKNVSKKRRNTKK